MTENATDRSPARPQRTDPLGLPQQAGSVFMARRVKAAPGART